MTTYTLLSNPLAVNTNYGGYSLNGMQGLTMGVGGGVGDAAADITYSDGCGGQVFGSITYRDIPIGEATPAFGDDPERAGYQFLGWDKTIPDTVSGDAIYTARWVKDGDPIPEPPEPVNPWDDIINPQTGILLVILLPIIVLIVGLINIYFKKKREA